MLMRRITVPLVFAAALCAGGAAAHDIPDEVHLHAFVKPEGDRLNLVVRIPLALLLNVDLPKRGAGYIDLDHVESAMPRAIAATAAGIALYEDGRRLQPARGDARISLPSDRSFESYPAALAHVRGERLRPDADVFWNQGWFDAHLEYPIRSERGDFALDLKVAPGLGDRMKVTLRYLPPGGDARVYQLAGGAPTLHLDPRWYYAAWLFVQSGMRHILEGIDHLLFLLCLVAPFRRLTWTLVGVVTAFTVAHSVTLIAGAYGLVPSGAWFPPLVEVLIAASILYMAIENVVRPNLRRRWIVAGAFGLVHGYGFSFLFAQQLQLAGSHLVVSLLAFNVGVELGQIIVLALALPALSALYRSGVVSERLGTIILSLVAGHAAWHWLVERTGALAKVEWPFGDSVTPAEAVLALAILLTLALAAGHLWRRPPAPRDAALPRPGRE